MTSKWILLITLAAIAAFLAFMLRVPCVTTLGCLEW